MSGNYCQIQIQIVFAVKFRKKSLHPEWRHEVFKYISSIITAKGQKSLIVNGVSDHVHILIGLKPSICLSDLVRDIKCNSSKFINEQRWLPYKFAWQNGFGAFSYSESQIDRVYKYIQNQEQHHRQKSFDDEYIEFLEKFNVDYDSKYLFDGLG